MNLKKISLITLIATASIALTYITGWFILANIIEKKVANLATETTVKTSNIKEFNLNAKVGCFPFICVNIKNVNIIADTKNNFNKQLNRKMQISLLNNNSININVKNPIFSTKFTVNEINKDIDLSIVDLNNKALNMKTNILFKKLNLELSKNNTNININNAILEQATNDNAFIALAQAGNIDINISHNKESTSFNYQLANIELFKLFMANRPYNLKHSLIKANYMHNKQILSIEDFKYTDSLNQIMAHGDIFMENGALNDTLEIKFSAKKDNPVFKALNLMQQKQQQQAKQN